MAQFLTDVVFLSKMHDWFQYSLKENMYLYSCKQRSSSGSVIPVGKCSYSLWKSEVQGASKYWALKNWRNPKMENTYRQTSPQTIQKWLLWGPGKPFSTLMWLILLIGRCISLVVILLSCIKIRLCARNTEADVYDTICRQISTSNQICVLLEKDKQVLFMSKHKVSNTVAFWASWFLATFQIQK